MRLRLLQSRIDRLERRIAKRAEGEFKATIDQDLADHYVQLKTQLEDMLADHKAGRSIDIELGRAIWTEMRDIRNTNELPTTDYMYKVEVHCRLDFLRTRREDGNYIPLSDAEAAEERRLVLLHDIRLRARLYFMPKPIITSADIELENSRNRGGMSEGHEQAVIDVARSANESKRNKALLDPLLDRYEAMACTRFR